MPSFCRHNRLLQNCPICTREQALEARPLVSPGAPAGTQPRPAARRPSGARGRAPGAGVTVRRLARGADDGYRCGLVPGLKSSADAAALAAELAFAAHRLERLAADPPGLYAEVRDPARDLEERLWLAFLIAYLGPQETEDPFAAISAARTDWSSGALPELAEVPLGPRSAHDPARGSRALEAYRAWVARSGSAAAAFTGDPGWGPERRFARVYERLALPGLTRDARYELLVSLGWLGVVAAQPATLALGGENGVTLAAKRALGIGDPLLLDRRAQALAESCGVPLGALDLGLFNWERSERARMGLPAGDDPAAELLSQVREGLGLD